MTFQVPVKTDKPSEASIHPIRLRATRVPSLPVRVIRGLLISIDSPCRMIVRCVQQQKATVPVSDLRAPDVSGMSTNPPPSLVTWMATRCLALAEPAPQAGSPAWLHESQPRASRPAPDLGFVDAPPGSGAFPARQEGTAAA